MIYTLKFLKNATKDYEDGLDYYDEISNELTHRFQVFFENTVLEIKNNPLAFQIRYVLAPIKQE